MEYLAIIMFVVICLFLMMGYPVAITLAGVSLLFAGAAHLFGAFDVSILHAIPSRIFGIMNNPILVAVPLFVFMGVVLEKSKIAEDLLITMGMLFGRLRGGLAISVVIVGTILAASTGIVGATVVAMGLLTLPTMLRYQYSPALATGTICASGTLGQVIPPSIVLILLGDVISNAYQKAQLAMGNWSPDTVSVGDLFAGAMLPGLVLPLLYIAYILVTAFLKPDSAPPIPAQEIADARANQFLKRVIIAVCFPLILIIAVLGSILTGFATPTEAASVGAIGAILMAILKREFTRKNLTAIVRSTAEVTAMVYFILIGATIFSLIFVGLGGDKLVESWLHSLPGGKWGALLVVMLIMFLLGFILDFIEIVFVVVPIVGPILLMLGFDPIWLGVMMAINLQTSFLTPPFGFALFYLRGVAPPEIKTTAIYRGVIPFIIIQVFMLLILALFPALATWLPGIIYG
ncbi:TRAP transporter large permease [Ostreibacterium oceani]|uniref:TRAP transporter large permease protein n=1 Tax=Ostreibacterium oceani TaxID=2654998 RepID=A0A6N7EUU1_9GAMM|nr:TRAP transporter large permease subunit [Ostreibacterium oceani]MPV86222.1 TRAP transporter large permease subunit [Ostreibacterium oceani]